MKKKEMLESRGFIDEKHLKSWLEECTDKTLVKEVKEFFGIDTAETREVETEEVETEEVETEEVETEEVETEEVENEKNLKKNKK